MKTYFTKPGDVNRKWHVIDASGQTLGRLCTGIAKLLMGKTKPMFLSNIDTGDYVIVINAAKVKLTGNKMQEKNYHWFSGYHGGIKSRTAEKMISLRPEQVIEHAVKGMLPKNRLGRAMFKKLKVYAGEAHPHEAQVIGSKVAAEGSAKS
ncbi:MAG TPA: 50S ribosomal protein L13 [Dehalococcoidia bacterium]|nr:50S ribosomal protein L13 [Dehalococcoidia bacterium]